MSFSIRLEKVVSHFEKNVTSFGKDFESLTVEAIRRYINKPESNPTLPFLSELLCKFPEINARWLINGEGPMLETDNHKARNDPNQEKDLQDRLDAKSEEIGALKYEVQMLRKELEEAKSGKVNREDMETGARAG